MDCCILDVITTYMTLSFDCVQAIVRYRGFYVDAVYHIAGLTSSHLINSLKPYSTTSAKPNSLMFSDTPPSSLDNRNAAPMTQPHSPDMKSLGKSLFAAQGQFDSKKFKDDDVETLKLDHDD
jgi:hypothetical protein